MQIFDDKKKRIGTLSGFKDRAITTTLDSGDKELTFDYPASGALVDLLKEEYYIRTKTDEFVLKAVEKGEQFNRQSKRVLSLRSRVRGGMSEHAQSQRKEPLTSRRASRHGMSCKSASRHTVVSASFTH